jgi:hypothetical protein
MFVDDPWTFRVSGARQRRKEIHEGCPRLAARGDTGQPVMHVLGVRNCRRGRRGPPRRATVVLSCPSA